MMILMSDHSDEKLLLVQTPKVPLQVFAPITAFHQNDHSRVPSSVSRWHNQLSQETVNLDVCHMIV